MILDSEAQRQNLLRLLDRVTITGAEAEVVVALKVAIRTATVQPPRAPAQAPESSETPSASS